jgi:hypothetical protein
MTIGLRTMSSITESSGIFFLIRRNDWRVCIENLIMPGNKSINLDGRTV